MAYRHRNQGHHRYICFGINNLLGIIHLVRTQNFRKNARVYIRG